MALKAKKGQAMAEYILALCAIMIAAVAVWQVVRAASKASARTATLLASEYP